MAAAADTRLGASLERDALLRRFIQTQAFCFTLSAVLHLINGQHAYEFDLLYSVLIGTVMWAIIDLSRLVAPLDPDSGWHKGLLGIAIVPLGIVGGFLIGSKIGDAITGQSTWDMPSADLRLVLSVTLLAGLAASLFFYFSGRTARQQMRIESAQRTAAEAQLRLLETQLEPHMLFNTLANLRVLINLDPCRAQQMLDRLIAYLRATLGASRATAHPLSAEFERLDDYLQLMAIRMGERLHYTLELPAELRGVNIPPLLLQPLVENAIKHGLEPCEECGGIRVSAWLESGGLRLEVADTGVGMSETASHRVASGGGFGLVHVRERLAKAYGGRASVNLANETPHGTRITLRLPLEDTIDLQPSPAALPAQPATAVS
jgi:signal transduction histidine kinase